MKPAPEEPEETGEEDPFRAMVARRYPRLASTYGYLPAPIRHPPEGIEDLL